LTREEYPKNKEVKCPFKTCTQSIKEIEIRETMGAEFDQIINEA